MYESPIEIIVGEMTTEWENGILKAVQNYNVDCNKEELIRALAYDRDQYQKGFEDGRPKWIPCSERLPEEGLYVVTNKWHHIDFLYYQRGRGWYHGNQQDIEGKPTIIAWMPLPEPYKEDDR